MRAFVWFPALFVCLSPSLAFAQIGGPVVFHGTEVTTLGNATATVASSRLFVGNLGSTGLDGFHLNSGGSHGTHLAWSEPLIAGAQMRVDVVPVVADIQPCFLVSRGAANTQILPDFSSMGAFAYRAEVWNAGAPVAHADFTFTETVVAAPNVVSFDVDMNGVALPLPDPFPLPALAPYAPVLVIRLKFDAAGTFDGPAGPIGFGDELRLLPVNATSGMGEIIGNDIVITVAPPSAPYTMAFDDVAQRMFGALHRGTGGATIVCNPTTGISMWLPAGVLGGMQTEMRKPDTAKSAISNLKFAAGGDTDVFSVVGELITGGQAEVGRVSGSCDGTSWSLTPDFSGSLSPDAYVQLFDAGGALVAENPSVSGAILVATNAYATETGVSDAGPNKILSMSYSYATPVVVTLPGAGPVTASRIAMHSNAAPRHKFFAIVDRTQLSLTGGTFSVRGEASGVLFNGQTVGGMEETGPATHHRGVDAWATTADDVYLQADYGCLVVTNTGSSGTGGVDFEPVEPQDRFGIEWAPPGPAGAAPGETDWEFLSRLAGDSAPVARMAVRMASDRTAVNLYASPRQTPATNFTIVLRNGGSPVAEFMHSDESVPFATLPDWPIAAGYQVLHYPDKTWSMWISLGYPMNVTIPGGPTAARAASAMQVVTADYIQVVFEDTPITSPVEQSMLRIKPNGDLWRLFDDREPIAAAVGGTPLRSGSVLHAPYPNPFNPSTTLSFHLAAAGEVTLKLYTVRGQYVATLHSGWLSAGPHTVGWDGVDHRGVQAASGVYLVEMRAPDRTLHAKMNLLK